MQNTTVSWSINPVLNDSIQDPIGSCSIISESIKLVEELNNDDFEYGDNGGLNEDIIATSSDSLTDIMVSYMMMLTIPLHYSIRRLMLNFCKAKNLNLWRIMCLL
jgi:hypothetical protein